MRGLGRTRGEFIAFGLGALTAGIASSLVWAGFHRRAWREVAAARTAAWKGRRVGQWNIAPGETLDDDGARDWVMEGSMESFPASDPPAY